MLTANDVSVIERRYFKEKPTEAEIRGLAALLPGGAQDLLSTRSRRYKEMGLAERELGEGELIALLATEPGLWRRPVVVRDGRVVIGYDAKQLDDLLS